MLKSGDRLQFTLECSNPVGFTFKKGDILELIEPTDQSPYGHKSNICNWIVNGPNGRTVWSSIWMMLESGFLKKI